MKKKLRLNKQTIARINATEAYHIQAGKKKLVDTALPSFDCKTKTCNSCACGTLLFCESFTCKTKLFCSWGLTCVTNCISDCYDCDGQ